MSLQKIRGTKDIFPEENRSFRFIIETARNTAGNYGYEEISTPIIESTNVFINTLGEVSDVVTKEMYTFVDRGGGSITLRPEGTAGIARVVANNSQSQEKPIRYFYQGPMFRYERPQKGRQRQFHQLGVEILGEDSFDADVEVLVLANHILNELGLKNEVILEINSLGDDESRDNYREHLIQFLSKFKSDLSEESKKRLVKNPLRILDSKNEKDKNILLDAPSYKDYLNKDSKIFFDNICEKLELLGISYQVNPKLVRGFDYYAHTAFEFITKSLGSQNAVIAGGRYNGLVKSMGGAQISGVGWAAGIERLALLSPIKIDKVRPVSLIPIGEEANNFALKKLNELRQKNISADMAFKGSLAKRMKRANQINSIIAIIIGEDELRKNLFSIKELDTGNQKVIKEDEIISFLEKYIK